MGEPSDDRSGGLLAGVRILDLSIWRPGPYATQLLTELGAEVIKVEPPGGDPMRGYPDLFAGLHADQRSVVLDLKDPDDRRRALDLAAEADVVVEGYRPGVADRLGVGYEDVRVLNPSVVYCSVSGLGQDGPLAQAPGHDLNYLAWSGALAPEGGAPAHPAVPVADLAGGMAAAFAISAALFRRATSGEGERIDVAMASVLATWTGAASARRHDDRHESGRADEPGAGEAHVGGGGDHRAGVGRRGPAVAGYGTFATGDGRCLTLGVLTEDHFWSALCQVLGLDDVADLDFSTRSARAAELHGRLVEAIRGQDRDELVARLLAAGVPVAPVLDRTEMLGLDHFRQVGAVTADAGADPAAGFAVRLTHHPATRTRPPPSLDQDQGTIWSPR